MPTTGNSLPLKSITVKCKAFMQICLKFLGIRLILRPTWSGSHEVVEATKGHTFSRQLLRLKRQIWRVSSSTNSSRTTKWRAETKPISSRMQSWPVTVSRSSPSSKRRSSQMLTRRLLKLSLKESRTKWKISDFSLSFHNLKSFEIGSIIPHDILMDYLQIVWDFLDKLIMNIRDQYQIYHSTI